jgi:hypothetical protein
MGTFNADDFQEFENCIRNFILYFIDSIMSIMVVIKDVYMETIHPVYVKSIKPIVTEYFYNLIYGDMEKKYRDAVNVFTRYKLSEGERYIEHNMTDYWNNVILKRFRKNYGSDHFTLQELLMNYYIHEDMFDELDNISHIRSVTLEIENFNGIVATINGLHKVVNIFSTYRENLSH